MGVFAQMVTRLIVEDGHPAFAHHRVAVDHDAMGVLTVRIGVDPDVGEMDAAVADWLPHPGLTGAEGDPVRPGLRHLRRHQGDAVREEDARTGPPGVMTFKTPTIRWWAR